MAFDAVAGGFYEFDPDAFESVELEEGDSDIAHEVFDDVLFPEEEQDDPYFIRDRLLQKALPILAAAEDTVGLDALAELVSSWAAHTRVVSLYLRSMIGTDSEEDMAEAASEQVARTDVTGWVRGWLIDPLARSDVQLPEETIEALEQTLMRDSEPWFVRGRAAVALAQRSELPSQRPIGALFEAGPPQLQAELLAAALVAQAPWAESAAAKWAGADALLQSVVELFEGEALVDQDAL